jgi:phage terminase small subunit
MVKTVNDMANDILIDAIAPVAEFRTAYDQLRPTERAFVDAYVATDDATGSALAAFPVFADGSKQGLSAAGARALDFIKRPMVQAAIAERMKIKSEEWNLTADRVLAEVAKIAYANIDDFIDRSSGEPIFDFHEVTREQMAAVGEITVETYMEGRGDGAREVKKFKFKLHDKLSALDKAMKRLGLYAPEQLKITQVNAPNSSTKIDQNMTAEQAAEAYAQSLREDEAS